MKAVIRGFARDVGGATAIEYALIGVLICLAVVSGATSIGQTLAGTLNKVNNGLSGSHP